MATGEGAGAPAARTGADAADSGATVRAEGLPADAVAAAVAAAAACVSVGRRVVAAGGGSVRRRFALCNGTDARAAAAGAVLAAAAVAGAVKACRGVPVCEAAALLVVAFDGDGFAAGAVSACAFRLFSARISSSERTLNPPSAAAGAGAGPSCTLEVPAFVAAPQEAEGAAKGFPFALELHGASDAANAARGWVGRAAVLVSC
mmetsp:Transcript_14776/g.31612  ORF Transcript_14776/g.31612 Transcript_14776/m.31612 type:complete len:204 (-) Transcript_14776:124-735(-)